MGAKMKIMVAVGMNQYTEGLVKYATGIADSMGAELICANIINERDVEAVGVEGDLATLGNSDRIFNGAVTIGKIALHLLGRLEVQLIGVEHEPIRISNGLLGLDTQQHLVSLCILLIEVMAVIGGHQWD